VECPEHLGSSLSDYRIYGLFDASGPDDAADLLVDRPVGGHNHHVGTKTFHLSYRFPSADDIDGTDAIVSSQPDDHTSQFGARLPSSFQPPLSSGDSRRRAGPTFSMLSKQLRARGFCAGKVHHLLYLLYFGGQ
jgi:hypothetical protein